MVSKMWTNTVIWLHWKHCGKRTNCSILAISPFPTMFSKAVRCWCIKMSIDGVKGYTLIIWCKYFLHNQNFFLTTMEITTKKDVLYLLFLLSVHSNFILTYILNWRQKLNRMTFWINTWILIQFFALIPWRRAIKKILLKRRKCWCPAFSSFPQCFQQCQRKINYMTQGWYVVCKCCRIGKRVIV